MDSSLNAYVTGSTYSTDFPVTPGAFQSTDRAGFGSNAFVTKLNPTGSAAAYSTYLGVSRGQYTDPIGYTTQEGESRFAARSEDLYGIAADWLSPAPQMAQDVFAFAGDWAGGLRGRMRGQFE